MFSGYSTVLNIIYNNFINLFSHYYLCVASLSLGVFLLYRVPYCYSPFLFCVFLITIVFSSFMSLFLNRMGESVNEFFSNFIPAGTPVYICSFICLAETISYIIRPIVLILRPFINISLGSYGAIAIASLCFNNVVWFCLLFILFLYEVFVAIVHWYIVVSILAFSVDH